MLDFLKNHPFAVESFFETSLVLTYAAPKEQLQSLIPPCLRLDTFEDSLAFIAVAMVKTKDLRIKGFPRFMGNDFLLTGYRVFVKYTTSQQKRLRGLYILRSETDKSKMAFLGNIFTHYNYQKTDITFKSEGDSIKVNSNQSGLALTVTCADDEISLPKNSPFKSWKEARRFAGPLPFTFTYNDKKKEVLIIEGVRKDWTPRPVNILESRVGFIEELGIRNAVLANAFVIHNIPYYWKKGKKDLWKQL